MTSTMPARNTNKEPTPLYVWRQANDLRQEDAAKLFGVSMSTYRRLELLKQLPPLYALAFETLKKKHRK